MPIRNAEKAASMNPGDHLVFLPLATVPPNPEITIETITYFHINEDAQLIPANSGLLVIPEPTSRQ